MIIVPLPMEACNSANCVLSPTAISGFALETAENSFLLFICTLLFFMPLSAFEHHLVSQH